MQNELESQPRDTFFSKLIIIMPFLVFAVVAGFLWAEWRNSPSRPTEVTWTEEQAKNPRIERDLMMLFPDGEGEWVSEKRVIRGFESERQEIQYCMEAFLTGPQGSGNHLSGIDRVTIAGVYLDGRNGLIIDLNPVSRPLNIGGVSAESTFIMALIHTIRANYPQLEWMMLLIDGEVRDTLAGHLDIREPFMLKTH